MGRSIIFVFFCILLSACAAQNALQDPVYTGPKRQGFEESAPPTDYPQSPPFIHQEPGEPPPRIVPCTKQSAQAAGCTQPNCASGIPPRSDYPPPLPVLHKRDGQECVPCYSRE